MEDGSSSESWLRTGEEGRRGKKSQQFELGLVVSTPGRNWEIGQKREAMAGSGPIGFGVTMSHPPGVMA